MSNRKSKSEITLVDAVEMNRKHPETFHIESEEARRSLQVGDWARLGFQCEGLAGERMWVKITEVLGDGKYVGTLDNDPVNLPLKRGKKVSFEARHIYTPMTQAEMTRVATLTAGICEDLRNIADHKQLIHDCIAYGNNEEMAKIGTKFLDLCHEMNAHPSSQLAVAFGLLASAVSAYDKAMAEKTAAPSEAEHSNAA